MTAAISGIDPGGRLHLVAPSVARRARTVIGIPTGPTERAWQVVGGYAVGDIVVTLDDRGEPVRLGAPMRVVRADGQTAVVVVDRRFGHHLELSRRHFFAIANSPDAALREVLLLWGVVDHRLLPAG